MTEKVELRASQWKSDGPKNDVFKLFEVESLEDVEISTFVNTKTGEILWKALKERKIVEIRISDKEVTE